MTKAELLQALEGLDDEATIYVDVPDGDIFVVADYYDKVTDPNVRNEITFTVR